MKIIIINPNQIKGPQSKFLELDLSKSNFNIILDEDVIDEN